MALNIVSVDECKEVIAGVIGDYVSVSKTKVVDQSRIGRTSPVYVSAKTTASPLNLPLH